MNGWERLPFDEVLVDETGGNLRTLQSEFRPQGRYPIVDQGKNLIAGYTDEPARLCNTSLPAIVFGDHTKSLKFIDFPFCIGADGTKVLRPKIKTDAKYIFHYLNTIQLPDAGYSRHFKFLKKIEILLPPLPEQKRIATILDQADALRRLRERSLKRFRDLGQSAFQSAFPAGARRPRTLGKIAFVRSSLVDPKLPVFSHLPHVSPEHLPSGAGSITWSAVKTAAEDGVISGKYEFDANCVLYSKIRPYLNKVALADRRGLCSADMYALEAIDGEATREFVFYALMQPEFLKFAESSSGRANIPKINRDALLSYELDVPGIEAQMDFSRTISAITNSKDKLGSYSESLEVLFSSLQQQAFRGDL